MQLYLYLSDALFYESKRELNRDYRTTGSRSNSEYRSMQYDIRKAKPLVL